MILGDFLNIFSLFTISLGIKIFLLTFTLFYAIFALIVLRQTGLMSQILNEASFNPFLRFLSVVHFLIAVGVFFFALAILIF